MFNKDYQVYRDAVDENNRWLFINREGKGFFDPTGFIDLENYTRIDPENKKKGQVLWKLKYNEKPHFDMGATLDDSDSEGEFDAGMMSQLARVLMNSGNTRFYRMKWKMFNEAKMKSVKIPGGAFEVKIKAKGFCTRQINITYTRDENGNQQRHVSYDDREYVNKITYKVKMNGATIDTFSLNCCEGRELEWDCGAFQASLKSGWFSKKPHEIHTKPGIDPGFALLFGHICITEFAPDEIKKDLKPNWMLCPGYVPP